jgi:MoaA/NifB/PqqE/SkfB family radical SAM enzyme
MVEANTPRDFGDEVVRLPKVEIYVTDVCNNRCSYCTTGWDNTENKRSSLKHVPRETIRAHLEEHFAKGARRVVFQGGEPTVRRDLGELLADARALGYEATTVFTNARAAASPIGARWLASMGVTWFQVSIQGGTEEAHDESVVAGRAFGQTIEGTRRLLALGQRVKVNGVLTRHLLSTLREFAALMIELRPEEVGLDVVRPSPAFAPDRASYEDLLPPLSRYSEALRDALLAMNAAGVPARVISCPPCLVPGAEHLVSDEQSSTVTQIPTGEFMPKLAQRRSLQVKPERCSTCAYDQGCPGVFGLYAEHHGVGELRPIAARRELPRAPEPALDHTTPLTRALRALFVKATEGPTGVRAVEPRPDGTHELLCFGPKGELRVLVAPRGAGPAYASTASFSLSYRADPEGPPPDLRLIDAVAQALRKVEVRLAPLLGPRAEPPIPRPT